MVDEVKEKLGQLIAEQSAKIVNGFWENFQTDTKTHRNRLVDFYKQYRGIPNRKGYRGFANVVVNETLSAEESIVAQEVQTIFSEPKYLMFSPREETDADTARRAEDLL